MNTIHSIGTIKFAPRDMTKKHEKQAHWKRVAMVMFHCDMADYYAWFIKKRYSIVLQTPLRGAHVTFINDSVQNMNDQWENVKAKWDGKQVGIQIGTEVRTDAEYWWLNLLPNETLTSIRTELGLGPPYFKYHMTIGTALNCRTDPSDDNVIKAMEMYEEQSKYIHGLLQKGLIT